MSGSLNSSGWINVRTKIRPKTPRLHITKGSFCVGYTYDRTKKRPDEFSSGWIETSGCCPSHMTGQIFIRPKNQPFRGVLHICPDEFAEIGRICKEPALLNVRTNLQSSTGCLSLRDLESEWVCACSFCFVYFDKVLSYSTHTLQKISSLFVVF